MAYFQQLIPIIYKSIESYKWYLVYYTSKILNFKLLIFTISKLHHKPKQFNPSSLRYSSLLLIAGTIKLWLISDKAGLSDKF